MSNLSDKFGGVGRMVVKAIPFVATYLLGRKLGQKGTREEAKRETLEQRELGEREAQEVRDQIRKESTSDYIRRKKI